MMMTTVKIIMKSSILKELCNIKKKEEKSINWDRSIIKEKIGKKVLITAINQDNAKN